MDIVAAFAIGCLLAYLVSRTWAPPLQDAPHLERHIVEEPDEGPVSPFRR